MNKGGEQTMNNHYNDKGKGGNSSGTNHNPCLSTNRMLINHLKMQRSSIHLSRIFVVFVGE